MITVGFTGTRKGMTDRQQESVRWVFSTLNPAGGLLHHGDCIGADAEAHAIARELGGWKIIIHPPENERNRAFCDGDFVHAKREYLTRNCNIVMGSDRMVATPAGLSEEVRSGTWHAIRFARRSLRPIYIVWPNGNVTAERA